MYHQAQLSRKLFRFWKPFELFTTENKLVDSIFNKNGSMQDNNNGKKQDNNTNVRKKRYQFKF